MFVFISCKHGCQSFLFSHIFRPKQNGHRFADDRSKWILLKGLFVLVWRKWHRCSFLKVLFVLVWRKWHRCSSLGIRLTIIQHWFKVAARRPSITLTNDGPVQWRIYTSPGLNASNIVIWQNVSMSHLNMQIRWKRHSFVGNQSINNRSFP